MHVDVVFIDKKKSENEVVLCLPTCDIIDKQLLECPLAVVDD